MSAGSKIEWTDATWNPVTGCTKVSAGCYHCYAERFSERFRGVPGHPFSTGFDLTLRPERIDQPLKWRRSRMIFVNSMSDLFHKEVPLSYVDRVFDTMERSDWHTFQVLTKRSSLMRDYLRRRYGDERGPAHIWCGVSVEDATAKVRVEHLRVAPAGMRFLSVEPLIGPLGQIDLTGIGWVIVGGESGPGARPMHPDWARSIRDQCNAAGVPFFFKQWGEWHTAAVCRGTPVFRQFNTFDQWVNKASTWINGGICLDRHGRELRIGADFMRARDNGGFPAIVMHRVGKHRAGRLLDGRTHDEFPVMATRFA